jgi:lysophospholipase L1-like esterase
MCKKWGVPVCNLAEDTAPLADIQALRDAYTTNADGTHPTEEGYIKFYCDKIEAWLKTL